MVTNFPMPMALDNLSDSVAQALALGGGEAVFVLSSGARVASRSVWKFWVA